MWLERLRKMKEANQRIDRHERSVEKIAIKSEVPKQTLEKIFSGSTKDPKLMTMQRLVYPLGYTLDDLFEEGPLRGPRTFPAHKLGRNVVESKITEAYQSKVYTHMEKEDASASLIQLERYLSGGSRAEADFSESSQKVVNGPEKA